MNKRFLKHKYFWLAVIFLATFGFRLFFVAQTGVEFLSDDNSYFHLGRVEYLIENFDSGFSFNYYNALSYSGRMVVEPPIFHYVLGFFGLWLPFFFVVKILPEILMSFLVIIVFLISKKISGSNTASLISALMSGFIPVLFKVTLNQLSIYSLVLPIFFLMIYYMMKMRLEKQNLTYFAILAVLFPLLHLSSFLLVLSLLFYVLIIISESWSVRRINKEAILFCIFITSFIGFLIFRKAFLMHGFGVIWQNIPDVVLGGYFSELNILTSIYEIGIIPVILGSFAVFIGFIAKRDEFLLLSGVLFAVFFLLILRLIGLNIGLMFLGIIFSILSSITLAKLSSHLRFTKFLIFKGFFSFLLVILIGLTLIAPSYSIAKNIMNDVPLKEDMGALKWMEENLDAEAVVMAPLDEGNLITAIAKRKNVVDGVFLLAPDAEERVLDVETLYSTGSEVKAIEILNKYDVDYIFLSEKSKQKYGITNLRYAEDTGCFNRVKYDEPKIYRVRGC